MTDPKKKPEQDQQEVNKIEEPTPQEETNWEENQRIDEEGNELDPEDIK
jgi:hypothetical protein